MSTASSASEYAMPEESEISRRKVINSVLPTERDRDYDPPSGDANGKREASWESAREGKEDGARRRVRGTELCTHGATLTLRHICKIVAMISSSLSVQPFFVAVCLVFLSYSSSSCFCCSFSHLFFCNDPPDSAPLRPCGNESDSSPSIGIITVRAAL